jgi:hypothetical protein
MFPEDRGTMENMAELYEQIAERAAELDQEIFPALGARPKGRITGSAAPMRCY